ncbi:hypothetical protein TcCL_NonESM05258, partial [Trypanosoma cruzi]
IHGAAFDLFVTSHSTGKGYSRGLATLVRGCLHEEFFFFFNFLLAVRNSCTTADTEGCGVSMESTIFIETSSTAACVYAPSRRTVEARKHTSTVLDHLATHIVEVPFCLAHSAEERAHGRSSSSAAAACPGTKHVMHKPRRRPTSHSSQTHGAPASSHWPKVLFVPDGSRRWLTAPPQQATGNPRARTSFSLVGKRPHWPASAARFRTNADGCYDHCKPLSQANVVGVRRGCRTGVVAHMVDAHGITRSQALRKFNFPGESERLGMSPEPPPATWARTRARDGTPIAPPPQTAQPRPKLLLCCFRTASYDQQAGPRLCHRHCNKHDRFGSRRKRPGNMAILLHPSRPNARPVDSGPKQTSPVSYIRAHERSKTELQPATKTTALLQCP